MPNTIITKFSEVEGEVPTTLAKGELAIDVTDDRGKVYYGTTSGAVDVLAQQAYVALSTDTIVNQKPGAFRWNTDNKTMQFSFDGVAWETTALSTSGGELTGNFKIAFDGHTYFETSQTTPGNPTQPNLKGTILNGKLYLNGDMTVETGGSVLMSGCSLQVGSFNVEGATELAGATTVAGLKEISKGSYSYFDNPVYGDAPIHVSTAEPTNPSSYPVGAIWYRLVT